MKFKQKKYKTVQTKHMTKRKNIFSSILSGSLIGFVNGFFGGGGGMIVVPLLTGCYKYPTKKAHATSIAIILPICIVSSIIYLLGNDPNWILIILVACGVTAGGAIGAVLLKVVSNKFVEFLFDGLMLVAGIKMLFFS